MADEGALPGPSASYPWLPDPSWPVLAPFWSGLLKDELRFPRCTNCSSFQWYPESTCTACGSSQLEWTEVPPYGHVYSFVVARRSFLAGFDLPLIIALVSIDEAPSVRLVTNVTDIAVEQMEIDQPLEIYAKTVDEGIALPCARPRPRAARHPIKHLTHSKDIEAP